jgi:hypothetical protein
MMISKAIENEAEKAKQKITGATVHTETTK